MSREPLAPALPAAVLWDMDGTLIDTEPYWMAEEYAMVGEAGGTWTEQDGLDLVGNDLLTSARIILERTPVSGTPEEVVGRLLDGVVRRTQERLPWRPGARELLTELGELGVPMALVTMSWTQFADVLVQALPAGTFGAVVTGDKVPRGKPHPDPYELAAEALGLDGADCIAVEDSPTGARSAIAAGVPTVVVPHMVSVPDLAGSVQVPSLEGMRAIDLARAGAEVITRRRRQSE